MIVVAVLLAALSEQVWHVNTPGAAPQKSCVSEDQQAVVMALLASRSNGPGVQSSSQSIPLQIYPQAGRWYHDLFTGLYADLDPLADPDPSDGPDNILDWGCGLWTYDGHDASDTGIRTFEEQAIGVPIVAAWDGVVAATHDGEEDMNIQAIGQPGNYVVIDHGNGRLTWYAHLKKDSVQVSVNDFIRAGQQIGMTASSGNSFGPHLHFSVYENGSFVEPFSGPCQGADSLWAQQRPLPRSGYFSDLGFLRPNSPELLEPPGTWMFGLPRISQIELADESVGVWIVPGSIPAFSEANFHFVRPDGSIAAIWGPFPSNNPNMGGGGFWIPGMTNVPDLHVIPGTWTLRVILNNRVLANAPFDVVEVVDPALNRPPEPVLANFYPTKPGFNDVVTCQLTTHLLVDDLDYDLVQYRYVWTVNGTVVRDVTTAALADILPAGSVRSSDVIACSVTPNDGVDNGPTTIATQDLGCSAPEIVRVHAGMNVFAGGHAVPDAPGGGGIGYMPVEVPLNGGADRVIRFPVVLGTVSPSGQGSNGPDGGVLSGGSTDVASWDGVAGVIHAERTMFLAGLFLGSDEPTDPAPPRLNVTTASTALVSAPSVGQVFFVGDGMTGTGAGDVQEFLVPPEATRLCLGFADASLFHGAPGFYDDNTGVVEVHVDQGASVACYNQSSFCNATDDTLAQCPCGNAGIDEAGCDNAQATGGVSLNILAQSTNSNGATLQGVGFPAMGGAASIVIRSNGLDPLRPVVFGDGLRCINSAPLVRLAATIATAGTSQHAIGHSAMAGPGTFYYQIWYRSMPSSYCTPAAFNLSSGRTLVW